MKVITIYSLKGGSGKSTLSILIAQYLIEKGHTVSLLDSDINQKSLTDWARNNPVKVPCYLIDNELTQKDIDGIKSDYVIIDGSPRTNNYIKNILLLSDYVLIPVQPTQIALTSLLQDNHLSILAQVEQEKPQIKINAVINGRTQHNIKDVQDVKKVLSDVGINTLAELGQRKAFVIDYDKPFMQCKNNKALNEIGYLVDKMLEMEKIN